MTDRQPLSQRAHAGARGVGKVLLGSAFVEALASVTFVLSLLTLLWAVEGEAPSLELLAWGLETMLPVLLAEQLRFGGVGNVALVIGNYALAIGVFTGLARWRGWSE